MEPNDQNPGDDKSLKETANTKQEDDNQAGQAEDKESQPGEASNDIKDLPEIKPAVRDSGL